MVVIGELHHPDTAYAIDRSTEEDTNETQDQVEDLMEILDAQGFRAPDIPGDIVIDGKLNDPGW